MSHAGDRAHRRPVGRRGQGQGHGPARGVRAVGGALPGRQQRRAHGGAARRAGLRAAPHPVGHPHARRAERDRQRRRRRPRRAAGRAGRAGGPRRRHVRPADQRGRALDHAVPRGHGQGHRAVPRQGQDRHHRPRHRPGVPGQGRPHRRPGRGPARREDPAPEGRGRARAEEPDAGQGLQPARAGRRRGRRHRAGARRAASPTGSPTPACCSTRRSSAARRSCSRAARARCSTSTTAPTPT